MNFRTVIFWIHLMVGLTAGAIIMVMSVTGVLLGFERQFIAAIDGAPKVTAQLPERRLPLDLLLDRASIDRAIVGSIVLRAAPEDVVTVRLRERGSAAIALDPYSADRVEIPTGGKAAAFMSALRRWHRWLGTTAEPLRSQAKAVTGAANLLFLFLVMSGFYLWWPRRWTASIVRSVTVPSLSLRAKARDFNWHNAIGFWSAIPLFLIVASGAFISYQWPGRWLDRAVGSPAEKRAATEAARAQAGPAAAQPGPPARVDRADTTLHAMFTALDSVRPGWRTLTITMPGARDTSISVTVAEGNTYRPDLRTTVVLDPASGAVRSIRGYDSLSTSRKIRAWVRFGHTGEVFGIGGQAIATIVSLGGAFLVWTGFALALRRFLAWRRRTNRVSPMPLTTP